MINDKSQVKDQISFILNGKPVELPKLAEEIPIEDFPKEPTDPE
jgi:hypothetical protein